MAAPRASHQARPEGMLRGNSRRLTVILYFVAHELPTELANDGRNPELMNQSLDAGYHRRDSRSAMLSLVIVLGPSTGQRVSGSAASSIIRFTIHKMLQHQLQDSTFSRTTATIRSTAFMPQSL